MNEQNWKRFELKSPNGYKIMCKQKWLSTGSPIVICVHGIGGSKESSVITALGERFEKSNIDVLAFDWAAHGESPVDGDMLTVDNCLRDYVSVLEYAHSRNPSSISVFATSFGGYLTAQFRNLKPEAFRKTVLRSPALRMDKVIRTILQAEEFEAFKNGKQHNFGFARSLILGRSFYEDVLAHDAFTAPAATPESVMIIQGDKDEVVDPADTIAYGEKNGIRVNIIEGAGHLYDHPGEKKEIISLAEKFLL